MKRFLLVALTLLSLMLPVVKPVMADYEYNVAVTVDGREVVFPDQKPFIDSSVDRTYVPLRFVSEALGGVVDWNQGTRTASVNKSGTVILMQIDSKSPTVNGQAKNIDAAAMLMNDRTVVPLRFVSECLGANVEWDALSRIVKITTQSKSKPGYRVTSMGYVVPLPENTKLEIKDKDTDVNLSILIWLPSSNYAKKYLAPEQWTTEKDFEAQFQQAEEILATKHGQEIAKAAVNYARKKTTEEPRLEWKEFPLPEGGKVEVASDPNTPYIEIRVWRV